MKAHTVKQQYGNWVSSQFIMVILSVCLGVSSFTLVFLLRKGKYVIMISFNGW